MLPIRVILCPIDFSEHSDAAFHVACSLARDYAARLVILHVAQPAIVIYSDTGLVIPPAENYRQQAMQQLHHLEVSPELKVERCLREGEAAASILQVADEMQPDVIVMGTHGRTGFGRLIIGSVAEDVLRKATSPVLTVRGQQNSQARETRSTQIQQRDEG